MNSDVRPPDGDREVKVALEASELRDKVEVLERRMRGTLDGGLAITALFVVAGAFMEQRNTLWFLGLLWLFFTSRLMLTTRACGTEKRIEEAALECLMSPPHDAALPRRP